MRLLSVDIETTGLDPSQDHILSIGLVAFDPTLYPSGNCATMEILVRPPTWPDIRGSMVALNMNTALIQRIRESPYAVDYASASRIAADWIAEQEITGICGKNYSSFDREFLRRLPNPVAKWSHRCIDPVGFFVDISDEKLPDLRMCLIRAGLEPTVTHNAVEDASQVAELVSIGLRQRWYSR